MTPQTRRPDIGGGFYTVQEAARLLGMDRPERITRWLTSSAGGALPVVLRDFPKIGPQHELSFLDLVEVRFVEHFRQQKISLQALRTAAANARAALDVSHPFATSGVKFQTDRKRVFLETAKEAGDPHLLDLMTNQLVIYEMIERVLEKSLEFDLSGFARQWRPAPESAPNVIVSPVFAFGRPVISSRHVPTGTLFQAWRAEGGNAEAVADWHDVHPEEVREAVEFELRPAH
jgi:uncharacterized protein (DUF433 family)